MLPVVCDEFDCERETIIQKGKKKNLVRDVAIYLSREMTGESGVSLGRYFGGISGSGVTLRYNHNMRAVNFFFQVNRRMKVYWDWRK